MALILGCSTMVPPTVSAGPVTMFKTPGGSPASSNISTSFAAHRGVRVAGLYTIVFPEIRAAPNFQQGTAMGKFHGVMQPTMPMGCLTVMQNLRGNSEVVVSPSNLLPSPEMYSRKSTASCTSPRPSAMTLPISLVTSSPSSSFRCRIMDAAFSRISPRFGGGYFLQFGHAFSAASTALWTSSFPPLGNVARISPVAGFVVRKV